MISLSGAGMAFGTQVLFENVSWRLQPGGHYGLVGANGTGKSTLLRIIAGELPAESGIVSRPNGLSIGTLGQDHFSFDAERPLDVVIGGRPSLHGALEEKAALLSRLGDQNPNEAEGLRLAELEAIIADQDGYTAEARAATLLTGLGLEEGRHVNPMRELSGGYRLRVLLARTLFSEPQLLLLDEPTNHLDIDSIRWMEGYLRAFAGPFVIVSHDRHFLNAVCNRIADLDYQELTLYHGNYDQFMTAKVEAVERKEAEISRTEEKIAETERFIERFRAKATKARQAQSRKKQLEKIEMPEIKRTLRRFPGFVFQQRRPSGREVLTVKNLSKAFDGHPVLAGVGFTLNRGDKMAVVGPNGIGKSTLLKIIQGELPADGGETVPGYEMHAGYMAQDHHEVLKGRTTVYQWLQGQAPSETIGTIRGTLGRVLFSGDEADKAIGNLSGGESARLLLAGLMLRRDNLLILDEPTNHLDLEGREALMKALCDFEGSVMFVSHDRHFVSLLADRVLALTHEGVEDWPGRYEDYLAAKGEDFLTGEGASRKNGRPAKGEIPEPPAARERGQPSGGYQHRKAKKRSDAKRKRRVERLEQEVARLEGELAAMAARFAADGYYDNTAWEEVAREQKAQQETKARMETAMADWERAAAELDGVGEDAADAASGGTP